MANRLLIFKNFVYRYRVAVYTCAEYAYSESLQNNNNACAIHELFKTNERVPGRSCKPSIYSSRRQNDSNQVLQPYNCVVTRIYKGNIVSG